MSTFQASIATEAIKCETNETPPAKHGTSLRKVIFRTLFTVALLGLLFWQIPLEGVWSAVRNLDTRLFTFALLLAIPTQFFQFLRWASLAKDAGPDVNRLDIHRGFWVGYTLGLVTPGRVGQYGRALALHNCSLARAAGLTFLERTYSSIVINGLGLIAIFVLPLLSWLPPVPMPGLFGKAICLIVGALILAVGIFPRLIAPPLRWLTHKLPFHDKIDQAVSEREVCA